MRPEHRIAQALAGKEQLMENVIVAGILVCLVGAAIFYLWKEKKNGRKCIGCPAAGGCSHSECKGTKESCNCHSKK